MPIHVGGHTRRAAERAGRLGDGFIPGEGDLGELIDIARQSAADAGRDPDALEITSGSAEVFGGDPVGAVEELAAKGVDRVVVPAFLYLNDTTDALAAFGDKVIAPTAGQHHRRLTGARRAVDRCGGPGRIRTSEGYADGFTARSLWPLGHRPWGPSP